MQLSKTQETPICTGVRLIVVGIDEAEATFFQDNGTEASHGTIMEDVSMDDETVTVEGTEAHQGVLTIEDGSMDNGVINADGAQTRRAERVGDAQSAQVVGRNDSMDSGSIAGAETLLGAGEDVEEGVVEAGL